MMDMKEHILTALREQYQRWEEILGTLTEEQISMARFDQDWSIQDVMAHLWAWQQISIARMEAAAHHREPEYPAWVADLSSDWEENANQTNAWIYEHHHARPWREVQRSWREGYLRFMDAGALIPERDLLDSSKYAWLQGYSPAMILLASYDHHQEHLEKLMAWLKEHPSRGTR